MSAEMALIAGKQVRGPGVYRCLQNWTVFFR